MNQNARRIIITRKSSFSGCALKFNAYLDGQAVGTIANGATLEVPIDCNTHVFWVKPALPIVKAPAPVTIPMGISDFEAKLFLEASLALTPDWRLEPVPCPQNRENSLRKICGFLLLLSSRDYDKSLIPTMEEFRRSGLELCIRFDVGAEGVHVSSRELKEQRTVSEGFDLNYRDLTQGDGMPLYTLTPMEQNGLAEMYDRIVGGTDVFGGLNVARSGLTLCLTLK